VSETFLNHAAIVRVGILPVRCVDTRLTVESGRLIAFSSRGLGNTNSRDVVGDHDSGPSIQACIYTATPIPRDSLISDKPVICSLSRLVKGVLSL